MRFYPSSGRRDQRHDRKNTSLAGTNKNRSMETIRFSSGVRREFVKGVESYCCFIQNEAFIVCSFFFKAFFSFFLFI